MFIRALHGRLSSRFERGETLGKGAYGEVVRCRDKRSGAERAVKIIPKRAAAAAKSEGEVLTEVSLLRKLDHPNIMRLCEFLQDEKNYYLVNELCTGGELLDEIIHRRHFTEKDAAKIMKQILSGVNYLHKHNVVHRDIKPENILIESKEEDALIKIADFGLSANFVKGSHLRESLGTALYVAPEVLRGTYDEKCDIWSCGVLLYILLSGRPPFPGRTEDEVLGKVSRGFFAFRGPLWDSTSAEARDLIQKMLAFQPDARLTAEECLQHAWFVSNSTRDDEEAVPIGHLSDALDNLKRFRATQKLATAVMLYIGSKLTTAEETKELCRIFKRLDRNDDGSLDKAELLEGIRQQQVLQHGSLLISEEELQEQVDQMLASVDFNRTGSIQWSEFVTAAVDRKLLLSQERLRAAFALFDEKTRGTIAPSQLRSFMTGVDDAEWEKIFANVDTNKDGVIDFEEFVAMMDKLT